MVKKYIEGASVVLYTRSGPHIFVLLSKRKKDPFNGMLQVPGGKLDEGEAPEQAAVREVKEETGISITEEELHPLGVYEEETPENKFLIHFYSAHLKPGGAVSNPEPEKHGPWALFVAEKIKDSDLLLYTLKPILNKLLAEDKDANNNNDIGHAHQT